MPHVMYLCTVYSLPYIGQTRSSSVSGRTRPSYETSAADLSCPFGAVAALCDAAAAATDPVDRGTRPGGCCSWSGPSVGPSHTVVPMHSAVALLFFFCFCFFLGLFGFVCFFVCC